MEIFGKGFGPVVKKSLVLEPDCLIRIYSCRFMWTVSKASVIHSVVDRRDCLSAKSQGLFRLTLKQPGNSDWETKIFWHSPKLGSILNSLYKIPLAQACFTLAQPYFHSHWRALVSQPVIILKSNFILLISFPINVTFHFLLKTGKIRSNSVLEYC